MNSFALRIVIYIVSVFEILSFNRIWPITNSQIHNIIHIMCGLLIALIPIFYYHKISTTNSIDKYYPHLIIVPISAFFTWKMYGLLQTVPFSVKIADMLPIMKIMCERFLNGEYVYSYLDVSGGMYPIYLPMMWLPYLPAVYFHFDLRFVSLCFFLVTIFNIAPRKTNIELLVFNVIYLSLMFAGLILFDSTLLTMSEESVVIFYYILFALSILNHNNTMTAISITSCLLSRFSLLFYFIFCFVANFIYYDRKQSIKIFGLVLCLSASIFVYFECYKNLFTFLNLSNNYIQAIVNNPSKYQTLVKYGLGVATFWEYKNLTILHKLFMIFNFAIPFLLFAIYKKMKNIPLNIFAVLVAKMCMVVFYNFLIMPYSYLFYTSIFFSFLIINRIVFQNIQD